MSELNKEEKIELCYALMNLLDSEPKPLAVLAKMLQINKSVIYPMVIKLKRHKGSIPIVSTREGLTIREGVEWTRSSIARALGYKEPKSNTQVCSGCGQRRNRCYGVW